MGNPSGGSVFGLTPEQERQFAGLPPPAAPADAGLISSIVQPTIPENPIPITPEPAPTPTPTPITPPNTSGPINAAPTTPTPPTPSPIGRIGIPERGPWGGGFMPPVPGMPGFPPGRIIGRPGMPGQIPLKPGMPNFPGAPAGPWGKRTIPGLPLPGAPGGPYGGINPGANPPTGPVSDIINSRPTLPGQEKASIGLPGMPLPGGTAAPTTPAPSGPQKTMTEAEWNDQYRQEAEKRAKAPSGIVTEVVKQPEAPVEAKKPAAKPKAKKAALPPENTYEGQKARYGAAAAKKWQASQG